MTVVLLGVGSNIERERYITAGLDALQALFGDLAMSSVYDSAAIGFDGQPFLNLVVQIHTDLSLQELAAKLRHIEIEHGRTPDATRFSARQLDIDILTYGNLTGEQSGVTLPRDEVLYNAFVLCPLAELVPDEVHPLDGRTYAALWDVFDRDSQSVCKVDFSWRGRSISEADGIVGG